MSGGGAKDGAQRSKSRDGLEGGVAGEEGGLNTPPTAHRRGNEGQGRSVEDRGEAVEKKILSLLCLRLFISVNICLSIVY